MYREFEKPHNLPVSNGSSDRSLMMAGMLFASGEKNVECILACQDNEGRFWNNTEHSVPLSFESAAALLLAYTVDAILYEKPILQEPIQRWLDDARKEVDLHAWVLIAWIASYCGLKVPLIYRWTRLLVWPTLKSLSRMVRTGLGFHLIGICLYALQIQYGGSGLNRIAKVLHKRQPKNPFFAYLASNYDAAAEMTYSYYINALYNQQGSRSSWAWSELDSANAWKDSCGHDFTFMRNILKHTLR